MRRSNYEHNVQMEWLGNSHAYSHIYAYMNYIIIYKYKLRTKMMYARGMWLT